MTPQSVRSIWISDTHLGNKNAQAEALLDFLQQHHCQTLYLVGDILDLWQMSKKGHWPKSHQQVMSWLLTQAEHTKTLYVPGNHDPFFRQLHDQKMGHIHIQNECVHELANGKKLLITHGDCFDESIPKHPWLFIIGELSYTLAVNLNRYWNALGKLFGLSYWSLPTFLKRKSKKAQSYIREFEKQAVQLAKDRGLDGIVCGHIHQAKLAMIDGMIYANDGDWLEGCHALIEHDDGSLAIIHWAKGRNTSPKRLQALLSR